MIRCSSIRTTLFVLTVTTLISISFPLPGMALEPAAEFLEGLRDRGYHELALHYLGQMKSNPLVPPDIKQTVLYEQGLTLIAKSRVERDSKKREALLDEAQDKFRTFSNQFRTHKLAVKAKSQLGNLLVERARMNVQSAKNEDWMR